jgi:hypothetical protein
MEVFKKWRTDVRHLFSLPGGPNGQRGFQNIGKRRSGNACSYQEAFNTIRGRVEEKPPISQCKIAVCREGVKVGDGERFK